MKLNYRLISKVGLSITRLFNWILSLFRFVRLYFNRFYCELICVYSVVFVVKCTIVIFW